MTEEPRCKQTGTSHMPVPVSPNQMEVLMKKLLKLPLRIATLPLIAILLVFQLISSLIVGLTSIVTNLLATVFLIGSVAGWIANAPSGLIFLFHSCTSFPFNIKYLIGLLRLFL